MKQPKIIFKGKECDVKEIEWKNGEIKKVRFYTDDKTQVIYQNDDVSGLTENNDFGYFYAPNLSEIIA